MKFFQDNPSNYMLPSYRLSPFSTSSLTKSLEILNQYESCGRQSLVNGFNHIFTDSGRNGLYLSLMRCDLSESSLVTIITSTGSHYISNCVTSEVEKFCNWNRCINSNTDVVIVVHEFGKICHIPDDLLNSGIKIIEDYAYSFAAMAMCPGDIKGDFAVFSLSKFFPVQYGGILLSKTEVDEKDCFFSEAMYSYYSKDIKDIFVARKNIYKRMTDFFSEKNLLPFMQYSDSECPGVFMFRVDMTGNKLALLKIYLHEKGIECSVFYGEQAFFIPCHQFITEADILYFSIHIESFLRINFDC